MEVSPAELEGGEVAAVAGLVGRAAVAAPKSVYAVRGSSAR